MREEGGEPRALGLGRAQTLQKLLALDRVGGALLVQEGDHALGSGAAVGELFGEGGRAHDHTTSTLSGAWSSHDHSAAQSPSSSKR